MHLVSPSWIADEAGEPPYVLRRPSQGDGRGAEEGLVGADNEQVEGIFAVLVKWREGREGEGERTSLHIHLYCTLLCEHSGVRERGTHNGSENDFAVAVLECIYICSL